MLKNKIVLIALFALFVANIANGATYYSFLYRIEEQDTFGSILKKFVKDGSIINAKTDLVQKTMKKNPQIKDWEKLPAETLITLYVSDDFMDLDKYGPYAKAINERLASEEAAREQLYPVGLKGSAFYMSSIGMFNQKADNVAEINFKQNSPVTLGAAFTYYPKEKLYSFSSSLYFSYLMASANSLTTDSITIPPEVGTNFYGEYRLIKQNMTVYAGPDYERFSVFNLRGLQNDRKIYVDGVTALYMTVGMAKQFTIFNRQFFTKLSVSKSLSTSYQNNAPPSSIDASDHEDNGKYSGYKAMLYLNFKFSKNWYLHTLLKIHEMSGPSKLSVFRIGAGIGYILF